MLIAGHSGVADALRMALDSQGTHSKNESRSSEAPCNAWVASMCQGLAEGGDNVSIMLCLWLGLYNSASMYKEVALSCIRCLLEALSASGKTSLVADGMAEQVCAIATKTLTDAPETIEDAVAIMSILGGVHHSNAHTSMQAMSWQGPEINKIQDAESGFVSEVRANIAHGEQEKHQGVRGGAEKSATMVA
jgi:hypothetical protein